MFSLDVLFVILAKVIFAIVVIVSVSTVCGLLYMKRENRYNQSPARGITQRANHQPETIGVI